MKRCVLCAMLLCIPGLAEASLIYELNVTGTFALTSGADEQGIDGEAFSFTFSTPTNTVPNDTIPGPDGGNFPGTITAQTGGSFTGSAPLENNGIELNRQGDGSIFAYMIINTTYTNEAVLLGPGRQFQLELDLDEPYVDDELPLNISLRSGTASYNSDLPSGVTTLSTYDLINATASSRVIPEPSTLTLTALALLAMCCRRRKRA